MSGISKLDTLYRVTKASGLGPAIGVVTESLIRRNVWWEYKQRQHGDLIPYETQGVTLFLDPNDEGHSQAILYDGQWEEEATACLRRETERVRAESTAPITVIEVGANRGYYLFQFADILGEDGDIYAFEPVPENIKSLQRGIVHNEFGNIDLIEAALGRDDGEKMLKLSTHSKLHTLSDALPTTHDHLYASEMCVDVQSAPTFLNNNGLKPGDIDIIRMDVEGYEAEILEGLASVFENGKPQLLFVEFHPHRVTEGRLETLVERIRDSGMELVLARSGASPVLETYDAVLEHLTVPEGSHAVELIAKRLGST
jgi:FkbM family methyltransferase